ncbi:hypothetical protein AX16_001916 [Volvariella volvacea WC 439]|nr:hypothetical protein AX16_001916 [Volvariella volvacea WC 439]
MTLRYTLSFTLSATFVFGLEVPIPLTAPTGAQRVSGSFISLSIEQDRWTDWSGTTSRNEFFFNVLDNLKQITGEAPRIRVGANSQDRTNFNPGLQWVQQRFPNPSTTVPYPEAAEIVVGDAFYQTAYTCNLGCKPWGNNVTAAYLQAQSILKAFSSPAVRDANIVLDAITFGNEPDLYRNNGLRSSNYSSQQYTQEYAFSMGIIYVANAVLADISAVRSRGLDNILGETNSYACHGAPGVSNAAGAVLWTLDYALFATQIGISRVFFHEGIGYKYNLIQPISLTRSILDGSPLPSPAPAHVQPQYYAAVVVAEALGSGGNTLVLEVMIDHPQILDTLFIQEGIGP